MTKKFGDPATVDGHKWQYYIKTKFAFGPMYMNGTLVWLQRYWQTWPVDLTTGETLELYRTNLPFNPETSA